MLIERNILLLLANGNVDAFKLIYEKLYQKIYSFAFHLTRQDEMAEDITQDVFVKIWNYRQELNRIENFEAWLSIVVKNTSYNVLKRMAAENLVLKKMLDKQSIFTENIERVMDGKELELMILNAIQRLPPQQRKIFLLSRMEGLKHNEIAQKLGISVFTVKNHIKSALHFLRSNVQSNIFHLLF